MRQELKLGMGIGAIVIAFVVGYVASRPSGDSPGGGELEQAMGPESDAPPSGGSDVERDGDEPGDRTDPAGGTDRAGADLPPGSVGSPTPPPLFDPNRPPVRPSLIEGADPDADSRERIHVPGHEVAIDLGDPPTGEDDTVPGRATEVSTTRPADTTLVEGADEPRVPISDNPPATQPGGGEITLGPSATGAAADVGTLHKIEPGDTFSGLAIKYLGDERHTELISKANPDLDPRRLLVGVKVKIPPPPDSATPGEAVAGAGSPGGSAGRARSKPAGPTYTVQDGEAWSRLAVRFMGKESTWPELFEFNRGRKGVGDRPHHLQAGAIILLPPGAKLDPPTPKPASESSGQASASPKSGV